MDLLDQNIINSFNKLGIFPMINGALLTPIFSSIFYSLSGIDLFLFIWEPTNFGSVTVHIQEALLPKFPPLFFFSNSYYFFCILYFL
jgi:hypothetical protein